MRKTLFAMLGLVVLGLWARPVVAAPLSSGLVGDEPKVRPDPVPLENRSGQVGANAFLVRAALGHRTMAMTGRYVNRDAHPLRQLADAVSGRVLVAMEPQVAPMTVEITSNPDVELLP